MHIEINVYVITDMTPSEMITGNWVGKHLLDENTIDGNMDNAGIMQWFTPAECLALHPDYGWEVGYGLLAIAGYTDPTNGERKSCGHKWIDAGDAQDMLENDDLALQSTLENLLESDTLDKAQEENVVSVLREMGSLVAAKHVGEI